jgi:hypothetical protein
VLDTQIPRGMENGGFHGRGQALADARFVLGLVDAALRDVK